MKLLDQYEGSAVFVLGDRRLDAHVAYKVTQDVLDYGVPGLTSWEGEFTAETALAVSPVGGTLERPDGRTGSIIIYALDAIDVTPLGSCERTYTPGRSGRFIGNGQAP